MNNTIATPNIYELTYTGDFLEELREAYLFAGLPPGNALEAAIADYANLFPKAA